LIQVLSSTLDIECSEVVIGVVGLFVVYSCVHAGVGTNRSPPCVRRKRGSKAAPVVAATLACGVRQHKHCVMQGCRPRQTAADARAGDMKSKRLQKARQEVKKKQTSKRKGKRTLGETKKMVCGVNARRQ
jgi:hypothetical protein